MRDARKAWARPLAEFVGGCLSPALARYGFGESDIVTNWPEIVGARVAAQTEPLRLKRNRSRGGDAAGRVPDPGTLVVRVEGGFALELQHSAPVVIERVNAHLGWRCVGRLALRQGPLQGARDLKPIVKAPDAAATRRAGKAAAGIDDEALRRALTRLGARVFGSS